MTTPHSAHLLRDALTMAVANDSSDTVLTATVTSNDVAREIFRQPRLPLSKMTTIEKSVPVQLTKQCESAQN